MPETTTATKITCEVDKTLAPQVQAAFVALRIDRVQVHARRSVVLRERAALPFLPPTTRLEEDPVEVYEAYLPRALARGVLLAWARALALFAPGRGAIYAEEVELRAPAELDVTNRQAAGADASQGPGERLAPQVLVNCVVQRGRGNAIARSALESGANVPTVNFGLGTGVRDRLGLLRIAIPAEKEIITLLIDPHDRDAVLDTLIAAGRLDQPGRGFIAAYPVAFGVANPKSFRGRQRHSATMDQVIAAIDELKSGAEWRHRSVTGAGAPRAARRWLTDLVNVTLNCNEASTEPLLAAALAAGAGGATVSKARLVSPTDKPFAASPAREVIDFGLGPDRVGALLGALDEAGAFGADAACLVETKPLPIAFTYLAA